MVMAVITMIIGNINNATSFVPRRDKKKPALSLLFVLSLPLPRRIAAFPAIGSINDTCFPAYSCVRVWQLDG